MTVQEFSDEFDTLYNSIASNQVMGITEYEKSVFLTKAQEELLRNYFNPQSAGNTIKQGFDQNEKRQIDFSNLIKVVSLNELPYNQNKLDDRGHIFTLNSDVLYVINEQLIKCLTKALNENSAKYYQYAQDKKKYNDYLAQQIKYNTYVSAAVKAKEAKNESNLDLKKFLDPTREFWSKEVSGEYVDGIENDNAVPRNLAFLFSLYKNELGEGENNIIKKRLIRVTINSDSVDFNWDIEDNYGDIPHLAFIFEGDNHTYAYGELLSETNKSKYQRAMAAISRAFISGSIQANIQGSITYAIASDTTDTVFEYINGRFASISTVETLTSDKATEKFFLTNKFFIAILKDSKIEDPEVVEQPEIVENPALEQLAVPLVRCNVKPLAYQEYNRVISKPYKVPNKYEAWRLITDSNVSSRLIEIIVGNSYTILDYRVRYVRKPLPIILFNESEDAYMSTSQDIAFNGWDNLEYQKRLGRTEISYSETEVTPCELDTSVHREILQRAVELAQIAYGDPKIANNIQAGQRSE